jgi:hypothetical protein
LWTSPVIIVSGYKYYLVILDDCSHFLWTFPLKLKYDTFLTLYHFFAYAHTQFGASIKAVECDNGREFDNSSSRTFFLTHGAQLRMSCPYTSAQNSKAERIICSTNNMVRSLLFQACVPPAYWTEALHTATHLLNILLIKTLHFSTPHFALFGIAPVYDHLRVFGCACYPNLSSTASHKLAPRSALCVFLGYSNYHKGYRCLDLTSYRIIIPRHVIFDESTFPFDREPTPPAAADFDLLDSDSSSELLPIGAHCLCLQVLPPSASLRRWRTSRHARSWAPRHPLHHVRPPRRHLDTCRSTCGHLDARHTTCGRLDLDVRRTPRQPDGLAIFRASVAPLSLPPGFLARPANAFGGVFTRRAPLATPVLAPAASPAPTTATPSPAPAVAPAAPLPRGAVPVAPMVNQHYMVTRAKHGL